MLSFRVTAMQRTGISPGKIAPSMACALALLCLATAFRAHGDDAPRAADVSVRQKAAVAILEKHCVECHGGRLTRSGLDLTTREGLLKGGAAGPAAAPGDAAKSLLYERVTHAAEPGMPYQRKKLEDPEISALKAWLDDGAAYAGPLRKTSGAEE